MSANELLEQVKSLSPRERRKFLDRVMLLEMEGGDASAEPGRKAEWPDGAARRRKIFGDKTLPNLVMRARAEERY